MDGQHLPIYWQILLPLPGSVLAVIARLLVDNWTSFSGR